MGRIISAEDTNIIPNNMAILKKYNYTNYSNSFPTFDNKDIFKFNYNYSITGGSPRVVHSFYEISTSDWVVSIPDINTARSAQIAEWNNSTTYNIGDVVKVSFETDGTTAVSPIYTFKAVTLNSNIYPPDDDGTNWANVGALNITDFVPTVWGDSINGFLFIIVYETTNFYLLKIAVSDGSINLIGKINAALDITSNQYEIPWFIERELEDSGNFRIVIPSVRKIITISSTDASIISPYTDILQNGLPIAGYTTYRTQDGLIYMGGFYNQDNFLSISRNGETKNISKYNTKILFKNLSFNFSPGNSYTTPFIWKEKIWLAAPFNFYNSGYNPAFRTLGGRREFPRASFDRWLTDLANIHHIGE